MALLTTPREVLSATALFICSWMLLKSIVRSQQPINMAGKLMKIHNRIQIMLSVVLLSLITLSLIPGSQALPVLATIQKQNACLPRLAYHYSKFYEYADILLMVAQAKEIGLHFGFHHLTTPWYTMLRVVRSYEGWWLFAWLNAFHHTFMHVYFSGGTWTRPILVYTSNAQLIAGILWDIWILKLKFAEGKSLLGNLIGELLLISYLVLHRRDVRMILEAAKVDIRKVE